MVDVLVAMQKEFVYLPDWWRQGAQIRELAFNYYQALRQVLRISPRSQRHLTRCRHCKLFFLPTRETGGEKIYAVHLAVGNNGVVSKIMAAARRIDARRGGL